MSNYDFNAVSKQKISLPVGMDIRHHKVVFVYSDSSSMRDAIEYVISPVVIENQNLRFQLPLFNHDLYYELISIIGPRKYRHLDGLITHKPGGPAQEFVRSINNRTPDNNGNIDVSGDGGISVSVDDESPGVLNLDW